MSARWKQIDLRTLAREAYRRGLRVVLHVEPITKPLLHWRMECQEPSRVRWKERHE